MSGFDYDLFVIGAGSGGVRAARIAARHGAKVAVAEEYRVGGTCVIRGCVPKKLFVYASKFAEEFEDAVGFGWTSEKVSFDWPTLVANKDKEIDRLNKAYIRNLEGAGAELIHERAVLDGPNSVTPGLGPQGHGAPHPRGHRGLALPAAPSAGTRTRHHLQRGLPPGEAARRASSSSAAATSRSNSPASSPASGWRPCSSTAASRSCAASMTTSATTSPPR